MGLTSLKDYSERAKVSYEAVRQQVSRYKEELGEHIIKDGRQNFLDDFAVAFLDERRAKNPVVVYQTSKDEEIERLKEENERLLKKITLQAEEITELHRWKADNALAIAEAKQTKYLLDNAVSDLLEAKKDVDRMQREAKSAEEKHEELKEYIRGQEKDLKTVESNLEVMSRKLDEEKEIRKAAVEALQEYKALPWYKKFFNKNS